MSIAHIADTSGQPISLMADSASDLVRARTQVGDVELTICTDGSYRLDGGGMFGVVPKALWQKRAPADDQNRILLGRNTVCGTDRAAYGAHRDWNRQQTAKASRFWSQTNSFCGDLSAQKPCWSRAFAGFLWCFCGEIVVNLWRVRPGRRSVRQDRR
jgi:hypothetical protein